jgi:VWFA-related protein
MKRLITFFLILIIFPLQISYPQKNNKPQFKVLVNVVSLDVEALDRKGLPVEGLNQSDFVVKENGTPVEISNFVPLSDVSVSLVIALGTAYLPQTNLSAAKNAIAQIIHLLNPKDEISLYTFDQKDTYIEQDFTRDRLKIISALENVGVASRTKRPGRFAASFASPPQVGLGLSIGLAAAKKGAYKRKALLLIRERIDRLGPGSLEHARESGCMLITLGFSDDSKNRLSLISDQSGAAQLIIDSSVSQASEENGDVTELCRTIAHLLLSRYNIIYYTSLPENKDPRQIEVLIPGHDYRVLAQRSFIPSR